MKTVSWKHSFQNKSNFSYFSNFCVMRNPSINHFSSFHRKIIFYSILHRWIQIWTQSGESRLLKNQSNLIKFFMSFGFRVCLFQNSIFRFMPGFFMTQHIFAFFVIFFFAPVGQIWFLLVRRKHIILETVFF